MKYGALASLILALAGCTGLPRKTPPTPALSVFVVAHPDDWQLFMNPDAFHAINEPNEKAVFLHVSAGDAGRGVTGEPTPYYLAREEGALRAIRFMANAINATAALGADTKAEAVERGGHKVARHTYANAVAYFMRVHDGNIVNGNDFRNIRFRCSGCAQARPPRRRPSTAARDMQDGTISSPRSRPSSPAS